MRGSCRWHPVPAAAPHKGPEAIRPPDGLRPQRASQQVGVVVGCRAAVGMCTQQMWAVSQQLHSTMPVQTAVCTAAVSCRGDGSPATALHSEAASCHFAGTPKLTRSLRGRQSGLSRLMPDAASLCIGTMLRAVLLFVETLLHAMDQAVTCLLAAATAAEGEGHVTRHGVIMTALRRAGSTSCRVAIRLTVQASHLERLWQRMTEEQQWFCSEHDGRCVVKAMTR